MVLKIDFSFFENSIPPKILSSSFLNLPSLTNRVLFNPTPLFEYKGKQIICVRAQSTKTIYSKTYFLEKSNDTYVFRKDLPSFNLEDPFICKFDDYYIFGGVQINKKGKDVIYRTVFYKGKNLESLTLFSKGPIGMKDIRLVNLNNKIGVFTRPQNGIYKKGVIGFTILDSIDNLKLLNFYDAKTIIDFDEELWGGVNHAFIHNNELCVIGHFAYMTINNGVEYKHYFPVSFVYEYKDDKISNLKLFTEKLNLKMINNSNPSLQDVIFPSGINIIKDKSFLYVGISDFNCAVLEIKTPF